VLAAFVPVLAAFVSVLVTFVPVLAAFVSALVAVVPVLAAFVSVLVTFVPVLAAFVSVLVTFVPVLAAFVSVLVTFVRLVLLGEARGEGGASDLVPASLQLGADLPPIVGVAVEATFGVEVVVPIHDEVHAEV
jgi:hypothetical protein